VGHHLFLTAGTQISGCLIP